MVNMRVLWVLVLASVNTWANSDSPPSGPVLRLELSPSQIEALRKAPPAFYYLCQYDTMVNGVHSSSLLRNGAMKIIPFGRVHDGHSDCQSLGAEHSDESVQYRPGSGQRHERGLRTDRREEQWSVKQTETGSGGRADREQYSGPGGWGGLATEVLLQTVFNLGIVILTGAARAGWLGQCGQWLVYRLMEAQPRPAPPPSPAQSPAHPAPTCGGDNNEDIELREICVEGAQHHCPPPVAAGGGLPV